MGELEHFLRAVAAEPASEEAWLTLADWLEGHRVPGRAELVRLHRLLLAICCEPERPPERTVWQARLGELLAHGVEVYLQVLAQAPEDEEPGIKFDTIRRPRPPE